MNNSDIFLIIVVCVVVLFIAYWRVSKKQAKLIEKFKNSGDKNKDTQEFQLLNDRYDDALRRIIIIHSLNFDITLYLDSEAQPSEDKVLYTDAEATPANDIDLYLDSESGGSLGVDFRVLVPTAYSAFEIEMTNLIRKYALVDKTFDIQFV
jgi:hypothetical protein